MAKNKLEINCFGQTMSTLHMKFHLKNLVSMSTTDSKSSFSMANELQIHGRTVFNAHTNTHEK